ncbi:hypothetical protein [Treponema sp. OMZ 906]|uniref:hypothetical protein n=1 Tax=Treponema sp. OMZ 906 TaxID=2563662 RepID=UPI0020A2EFC4|nr:hypothetical protein [Treponema sp. OMZ 906]UTC54543.1 hypothetical protein E4N69_07020 [Treponema sp. OMZ 906]
MEPRTSVSVLKRQGLVSEAARMPLVLSEAMFRRYRNSLPKAYKDVRFWQCDAVDAPYISKESFFALSPLAF